MDLISMCVKHTPSRKAHGIAEHLTPSALLHNEEVCGGNPAFKDFGTLVGGHPTWLAIDYVH